MPDFLIPYGSEKIALQIPEGCQVDWIEPPFIPAATDPDEVVRKALANPIDENASGILAG